MKRSRFSWKTLPTVDYRRNERLMDSWADERALVEDRWTVAVWAFSVGALIGAAAMLVLMSTFR